MNLAGKVALVTGGSGDIGGAIARRLGKAGAHVVVTYVGAADAAAATVSDIEQGGGSASAVQLDQRSPPAIEACIEHIAKTHARLDILVNNAAWNIGIPFANLDALTPDIWDRVLETNLRAPFLLSRARRQSCSRQMAADTSSTFLPRAASARGAAASPTHRARRVSITSRAAWPWPWRHTSRSIASHQGWLKTPAWQNGCRTQWRTVRDSRPCSVGWGRRTTLPRKC